MKSYQIPCTWMYRGYYEIDALDIEDAQALALERGYLPEGTYVEDSFQLDIEVLGEMYPVEIRQSDLQCS